MLFIHSAMHTVQYTLLRYTTHHITSHFSISIPIIDIPSFCFPAASPFPFAFFFFFFFSLFLDPPNNVTLSLSQFLYLTARYFHARFPEIPCIYMPILLVRFKFQLLQQLVFVFIFGQCFDLVNTRSSLQLLKSAMLGCSTFFYVIFTLPFPKV